MKRLIVFLTAFVLLSISRASNIESYNEANSSFTKTSDGPVQIKNTFPGTVLLYVDVSTTSTGSLQIYDSSGVSTSGQLANITLGTIGYYRFEILISSGLTYQTVGNQNGVTIVYKKSVQP
jgi:hypothetical protein